MGDPLKKVQSGQKLRIPAASYNAFIDTARDLRQRQQGQEQNPQVQHRDTGIVLVKNSSGADRKRFDVLGVSDALIKPADNLDQFKNKVALVGVTPLQAEHEGRFVILLEPVTMNALGLAVAAGASPVQIDVAAEADAFADVKDNDAAKLQSGSSGAAAILWKESGTGLKWAVVRIGAGGGGGETACAFQYQSRYAVAANVMDCGFMRAHPVLP